MATIQSYFTSKFFNAWEVMMCNNIKIITCGAHLQPQYPPTYIDTSYYYKYKNHFYKMKRDIGMADYEKLVKQEFIPHP